MSEVETPATTTQPVQPKRSKMLTIGVASVLAVIGVVTIGYSFYQESIAGNNKTTEAKPKEVASLTEGEKADPTTVLAKIGEKNLTRGDLDQFLAIMPPQIRQIPLDLIYKPVLDQFVNSKLAAAEAYKAGLDTDAEVIKRLQEAQDQIIQDVYLNRKVEAATNDAAIDAVYQEMITTIKPEEERKARHILLKTEDEAKAAIAKLKEGKDFAALATELSTDPGQKDGGDLGFFKKDQMVPEFADVAFGLEVGQYTETPVKSQFGYHVIKVEDKRTSKPPSKEEMAPQLKKQIADKVLKETFDVLREKEKVQLFGLDGKPMTEAEASMPGMPAPPVK